MDNSIISKFSLAGKTALVTGGVGLLGSYSAATFAAAGANVVIVDLPQNIDRARALADELHKKYGVRACAYGADLTNEAEVNAMFEQAAAEMGSIEIVHSNAGVGGSRTPDYETPLSDWLRVIYGNLVTMFLVDTAACRIMIRQGHGGSIINTCSMAASCVMQGPSYTTFDNSSYGVSKAGVLYLTKSLASQVIRYGIRVNSISPGHITPAKNKNGGGQLAGSEFDAETMAAFENSQPIKRTCDVEELMGGLLYLASDASSYCVGMDLLIDGGHTIW
jgi:sorbose reductase